MKRTTLLCALAALVLLAALGLEIFKLRQPSPAVGPAPGTPEAGSPTGAPPSFAASDPAVGEAPPDLPSKASDRSGEKSREAERAAAEYQKAQQEQAQLENQIAALNQDQRSLAFAFAAELELPDNLAKLLYPPYQKAQKNLTEMMNGGGMGESHPVVRAQKEVIASMTGDLEEAISALQATLKEKARGNEEELKRLQAQVPGKR
ncbi:MAG: hypothetical protein JWO82_1588 [Akkermansiaceae bacterium]|nr:hypothetical protein [Akkermansiaceae bacterium]